MKMTVSRISQRRVSDNAAEVLSAPNKLGAKTDAHAVEMWLSEHAPGTRREYERHAKRLLAWLSSIGESLGSCTYEHFRNYFDQLDDPVRLRTHIEQHVSAENRAAFARLFALSISEPAQQQVVKRAARSRTIIIALVRWLQIKGYLAAVAIPKQRGDATARPEANRTEVQRERLGKRVLSDAQWQIVDAAISRLDWQEELQSRCRAIAVWLRDTGARRHELAAARLDAMQRHRVNGRDDDVWLWRIRGKRKKVRYVVVTPQMLDAFKRYRLSRDIPYFENDPFLVPQSHDGEGTDTHLFHAAYREATAGDLEGSIARNHRRRSAARSISITTIYNDIKLLARAAASLCANASDRERVAALSPHWFRHRLALELSRRLTPMQVAQHLGHRSLDTTMAYSMDSEVDLALAVLGSYPSQS